MKQILPVFLGIVTILASHRCYADPIGPKPEELTTVRGFQLSITAPSNEFKGGELITIDTQIKNVSDKSHNLHLLSNPNIYKWEVTTEKGEKVPLTRYGYQRYFPLAGFTGAGPLDLAPGLGVDKSFAISRWFDMSAQGIYLIKVKHGIWTELDKDFADATSNVLRIKVTD